MGNCCSCCKQNNSGRSTPREVTPRGLALEEIVLQSKPVPKELNLLLMGKTGVGKSATGNAILRRRVFVSRANFQSVTVDSKRDIAQFKDGRKIRIVDTPGVADTGFSQEEGKQKFAQAIQEAIGLCVDGYDALLLTIKYGNRLTKEDVDMIDYLKEVFGEEFLKKHGIIVVTAKDSFNTDPDVECTFEEWCERQGGIFSELYTEVSRRVILFNNRGEPAEMESQRQKLFQMVDDIGERYTNEAFQKAAEENERMKKENKLLGQDIAEEMSLVFAELNTLNSEDLFTTDSEKVGGLKLLKQRVQNLVKRINDLEPTEMSNQAKALVLGAENQITLEIQSLKDGKLSKQRNKELDEGFAKLEKERQILRDCNNETWYVKLAERTPWLGQAVQVGGHLFKAASAAIGW